MRKIYFSHETVLLNEAVNCLNVNPEGIYFDGTAGGGGHSQLIASKLTTGRVIAIDVDSEAVAACRQRLADFNVTVALANYRDIKRVLDSLGVDNIDGMLLDLGVSSHQLDTEDRGFSYKGEGSFLDMRMGNTVITAADIVATYDRESLMKILRTYGDESFAPRIVDNIIRHRQESPITTTAQLAEIVADSYPAAARRKGNPSRKTFQALRIEVNHEMENIEDGIKAGFSRLKVGGRIAVISFHSLEDRVVKNTFKTFLQGCTCAVDAPICVCGKTPAAKRVLKRPVVPTEQETSANRRSRSARLRCIEKLH